MHKFNQIFLFTFSMDNLALRRLTVCSLQVVLNIIRFLPPVESEILSSMLKFLLGGTSTCSSRYGEASLRLSFSFEGRHNFDTGVSKQST
jgi:uncharacterized membrane protein